MSTLCRDCLSWSETKSPARCPSCASPRLVAHEQLSGLNIAHMDCDAFYAAVEKRDNPELADKALIIGGGRRGVVSTCCYIARVAGVRSAMPMFKALKLCPDANVVKPRMAVYADVGREIRTRMRSLTPAVEPLSLDEAFLDLTGTERLLGHPPAAAMAGLALEIERDIGITVSVGLSYCKFLAKTASDLDKPRGFSVIGQEEALDFLAPRSVRTIWGVGRALADKLEKDGMRTNADLRNVDLATLVSRYGQMGKRLHELCRGIDSRRVTPDSAAKSISSETTFNEDLADPDSLMGHLWRLAVRTSDRAKAKATAGMTVTLKLKTHDFRTITRQGRLEAPSNLTDFIYGIAEPLLMKELDRGPFRLIGVGISDLVQNHENSPEKRLFADRLDTLAKTEAATDSIRARFGEDAIHRGRALR